MDAKKKLEQERRNQQEWRAEMDAWRQGEIRRAEDEALRDARTNHCPCSQGALRCVEHEAFIRGYLRCTSDNEVAITRASGYDW